MVKKDIKLEEMEELFKQGKLGSIRVRTPNYKLSKEVQINLTDLFQQVTGADNPEDLLNTENIESICLYEEPNRLPKPYETEVIVITKEGEQGETTTYPLNGWEPRKYEFVQVPIVSSAKTISGNRLLGTYQEEGIALKIRFIPKKDLSERIAQYGIPIINREKFQELTQEQILPYVNWTTKQGKLEGKLNN